MHNEFTAVFERDGDWYVAYSLVAVLRVELHPHERRLLRGAHSTVASSGSRVLAYTDWRNARSSGRTERSAIAALSSSCVTVPAVTLSAGRRPASRCRCRTSGTAVRLSWLVAARRRSASRPLA